MTNSTNRNIVIWAYGEFFEIANEAVLMYQSECGSEVTFQVVDMHSPMELYENLTRLNNMGDESSFNELPNILLVHDEELKQYLKEFPGFFAFFDNDMDTSMFMSYKMANVTHLNAIYGFPCSSDPVALYYRKDILDNIGMTISDNLTWDDFIHIGEDLKANDDKYLLAFSNNLTQILMQSTGQLYYDVDGNISSVGAEDVLNVLNDLKEREVMFLHNDMYYEEIIERMIQGDIVSIIGAPWLFTMIKDKVAEMNLTQEWAVARIPKSEVLTNEVNFGGCSWMLINKGEDEDKELVFDFLGRMFGNNQEIVRKLAESDIVPVTYNAGLQLNDLDNNGCFYNQQVIKFLAELGADAPEIYYGTYTEEMTEELNEIAMNVFEGIASVSVGYSEFEARSVYYGELDPPPEPLPDTSPDESILIQLSKIEIEGNLDKTQYYVYEEFKPKGIKVRAYFTDGTDRIVRDYSWEPLRLDLNTSLVTISYTYRGVTKTDEVKVSVSKEKENASKLNQTELKYSCGAGDASVNLFTKRLLFEHQDMSIGANSYQIGVSHVYNSDFDENVDLRYGLEESSYFKTYMGKGFKLNVQQYVFAIDDHYVYIDGAGYRHTFVALGDGQSYYDTSGLGLMLTFENDQKVISDEAGNKMYFDATGRLEKTVSCHNEALVKKFVYNSKGQLVLVYDNRTASNQIKMTYDNVTNLLKTMTCGNENSEKDLRTINYTYDSNGYLTEITDEQGGAKFVYDSTNAIMQFAISKPDNYALKFENTDGKVTGVIEGAYDEDSASIPDDNIRKRNYYTTIENGKGVTVRDQKGTTAYSSKDLNVNYYFNEKGFTTAILEANNGNSNKLRSMKKLPGTTIPLSGTEVSGVEINTRKVYEFKGNNTLTVNSNFNDVVDYRKSKYNTYVYYNVSFWMKLKNAFSSPCVRVQVISGGLFDSTTEEGMVRFDNTAVDVWQYVTVPVKISKDTIKAINVTFDNGTASEVCHISDMRLTYAAQTNCYVKGAEESAWAPLNSATKIRYKTAYGVEENKEVNVDCYMSAKDLQATFMSMYKNRALATSGNYFLSLCDGTKKIKVKSASIYALNEKNNANQYQYFPLEFDRTESSSYGLALYNHETISPDGSTSTYGYVRFYPSVTLGTYNGSAIMQLTKSKRGDVVTESYVYVDLKGRVLQECDEYGVTTTYEYDSYGSVTKKTVSHKDGEGETFVYEATVTDSTVTETAAKSYMQTTHDALLGHPSSSTYDGFNQATKVLDGNGLTTAYTYDENHRLKSVSNGFGQNSLSYDSNGRLFRVLAQEINGSTMYGFKTVYNSFNEPTKYYLVYGTDEDLLVTKTADYAEGTVTMNREGERTIIYTDKYGRTSKIYHEEAIGESTGMWINFGNRQDLWESAGAAEVVKIWDPYEQKDYLYTYDEFNNLTGYAHEQNGYQGKAPFSVKQTGPMSVTYSLARNSVENMISTLEYDTTKIISPRINKVSHQTNLYTSRSYVSNISYVYDEFGRVKGKTNSVNSSSSSDFLSNVTTSNTYVLGTNLKNTIVTNTATGQTFTFGYDYDTRGRVWRSRLTKGGTITETEYSYDKCDRVISETTGGVTKTYSYRADGSLSSENNGTTYIQYTYNNQGRLISMGNKSYGYDLLGNCNSYNGTSVEWERGNLMSSFGSDTTYSYNAQNVRFKKTVGEVITEYVHDGGKLLAETEYKNITDAYGLPDRKYIRERVYFYDLEGIVGFGSDTLRYNYVKDAFDNVVSIVYNNQELARYSYDAFGKCKVLNPDGTENTEPTFIGNLNPIRWKSLYYDVESGLYYIDGRYYSPEIRQFLSPLPAETMFSNALTVFGLNPYLITLDNCVNRGYNGYTIHPSVELAYNPEKMSDWTWFWSVAWPRFWNSDVGKGLAIGLFVLSIVATVCMATFTCLKAMAWAYFAVEMGSAAVGFFAGAAVAGFQSMSNGGNFWAEFANYINDNWSQTLAITSVMIMATYAAQAVAGNICFIAGTLVLTAAGYRAIEDIQIGDMVLAYDEETGETAYKPVVRLFRNESKDWTGVTVNGLEIVSTPGHKYFLPETKKWVSAEDLKVGTKVLLSDGSYGIIEAVRAIHYDVPQTTYNFEVADFHTYYVGQHSVLVHNKGCDLEIEWPPNNGFEGNPEEVILQPGELIDRYGYNNGSFVSPKGTPFKARSLPASYKTTKPYHIYKVQKAVTVLAGKAAPWFNMPGRGIQYMFSESIEDLIRKEVLLELL